MRLSAYISASVSDLFSSISNFFLKLAGRSTGEALAPQVNEVTEIIEKETHEISEAMHRDTLVGTLVRGSSTLVACSLAGGSTASVAGFSLGVSGAVIGGAIGGVIEAVKYLKNPQVQDKFSQLKIAQLPPEVRVITDELFENDAFSRIGTAYYFDYI